nr:hypothetical protein [Exiguobacterium sp. SL14]
MAVLLGAVFSSFNSLLNSIATLFVLDIYQLMFAKEASDEHLIRVSKWFGTIVALISFVIAPFLMYAPDGLWSLIRQFTGFFNIPILVIVLMGIFMKRIPAILCENRHRLSRVRVLLIRFWFQTTVRLGSWH